MTPLVLVHGFMGGSAQWAPQKAALGNQLNIVTVDLPGFGTNADMPAIGSISEFADWVLDQLSARNIDRFHLLGHSMGGMIVQEMIHHAPERVDKLVLYATSALGLLPGRFETMAESKRRAMADGPVKTARRISATWFLEQEAADAYSACAEIAAVSSLDAISRGLDAMESWNGENRLASIDAETLVIWGDRDRTYAWPQIAQLWQGIPGTSLAVFPDCAHAVHLEKPDLFNAILQDFLARPDR